ncbi:AER054Wp [Eremothecium gossypii ATCC 10895]|uniref:AER054Wp n=1 Tax=Eremothecium gossypii (strain ATCC 10895 / CBS 109.51 / FGSC 9923 / NRRL Y-1056) TaxID=284811 RepID=Q757F9_EREGS|nr:AER054Wp [Eremothecium gossypii ATCC 10895]AAS52738.1 AER054Wp [Eremothecium gossypii ATCC 10895]AEY97044.1 FAER054Wp [Eremothecium gossypii FDAG1]
MARIRAYELITIGIVSAFGIYSGVNFFEPIVVNQLRQDGHLRQDVEVPEFDADGNLLEQKLGAKTPAAPAPVSDGSATDGSKSH